MRIPIRSGAPQADCAVGTWAPLGNAGISAVHLGVHLWDVEDAHVSIINLASVRALSTELGVELDPARFRANIYLEGLPAWQEFEWLGRHLSVGEAELAAFAPVERCRATSARPGGTEWDINVPGALARHFGHVFCGLYARVTRAGAVVTGDTVNLAEDRPPLTLDDGLLLDPSAPRWTEIVSVAALADGVHSLLLRDSTGMLAGRKRVSTYGCMVAVTRRAGVTTRSPVAWATP